VSVEEYGLFAVSQFNRQRFCGLNQACRPVLLIPSAIFLPFKDALKENFRYYLTEALFSERRF